MGIPPDYSVERPPEYPPLPDEYNRFPQIEEEQKKHSLMRKLLLLAFAGFSLLGLIFLTVPSDSEEVPENTVAADISPQTEFSSHTPAPFSAVIASPSSTLTPEPTATAEPTATPVPTPAVRLVFYRTSSVYHGMVLLEMPESILSVQVLVWDEAVQDSALEHTLSTEEIASGSYEFTGLDLNDFYGEHREAYANSGESMDPVLKAVMVYQSESGEQTVTVTQNAEAENWVSVSYDAPNDEFTDWFFGSSFPDSFVARVYDSPDELYFTTDPNETLLPGGIFVSVTADGQTIPAESCILHVEEDVYTVASLGDVSVYILYYEDGKEIKEYNPELDPSTIDESSLSLQTYTYYYYYFEMPRPSSFPEHGTAHVVLRQKLFHFDVEYSRERDIEY